MVCPVANRSQAVVPTVRSVLAQTMDDLELIAVLDGCTDDTAEWVRRAADGDRRVTVVETARCGHPSGPRSVGLDLARADVAYIDHDDVWRPEHLQAVSDLLDAGADVAATGYRPVTIDGSEVGEVDAVALWWHPELQLMAPLFQPSTVAHRRAVVERVGGWRIGPGLEDWDLWLRLSDAGASFATSVTRSVLVLEDGATRRFRTARPYRMTLASFTSPAGARALADVLRTVRSDPGLAEKAAADVADWYLRLARSGTLVPPRGWPVGAGVVDAAVAAARRVGPAWLEEVVVLPHGRQFAVAVPLWCATAAHAQRFSALANRVFARQLATVRSLAQSVA